MKYMTVSRPRLSLRLPRLVESNRRRQLGCEHALALSPRPALPYLSPFHPFRPSTGQAGSPKQLQLVETLLLLLVQHVRAVPGEPWWPQSGTGLWCN